ncbi:MAG TPA: TonB family protein [Candidatus Sulfotelmatobacter sp.]|nr:TonB family protein [Candidatus Sulfotelmatobacter sp.]
MAYQALLFCPEEKTARTVTQVLGELEFQVEPCTEPFAAVKKLMSQHFDAVVVDCDNEQNATLLFKSARNSTSNQASLAVAIVEGQAGVAKAFRIGANLVLTKPINVEQSKGTLRVARGLLRKGEPLKAAATATAISPTPAPPASPAPTVSAPPVAAQPKPSAPRPAAPIKTEAPAVTPTTVAPRPSAPVVKPATPAVPARATVAPARTVAAPRAETTSSRPVAPPVVPAAAVPPAPMATPLVEAAAPIAPPIVAPSAPASKSAFPETTARPPEPPNTSPAFKPKFVAAPEGPVGVFGMTGAASAPAPAREVPAAAKPEAAPAARHSAEELFEKPAAPTALADVQPVAAEPAASGEPIAEPAPSFTFGGANTPEESTGSGKKVLLLAAFALIIAVAYLGWNYFQGKPGQPSAPSSTSRAVSTPATSSAPPAAMPATKPVEALPQSSPQSQNGPSASDLTLTTSSSSSGEGETAIPAPAPNKPTSSAASSEVNATKPAEAPLVVKGGSAPEIHHAAPATDAAAPSVVGIAVTGSDGALSNIVGSGSAPQPVLQTLNISQGVSSGLILKRVQPVYPKAALAMRTEGAVELQATISKSGAITGVKVLKGDPQLSRAAVEAVKQWKYKPYLLNGEPVDIQTQITVNFRLPH